MRNRWLLFRRGVLLKTTLLAMFILGAKWIWIDDFAGEIPHADQWAAEGAAVYARMLRGEWSWTEIFKASNEHRIVTTRLLSAGLFALTGYQWDPTLQLVASSFIHAFWLGLVGAWLMRRARPRLHGWICALLATVGALPFA